MPIYRLTPINLEHNDWRTSTFHSSVVVRAKNEESARFACKLAFSIATERRYGEKLPLPAWDQGALASCEELPPSKNWPADGLTAILEPRIDDPAVAESIAKLDQ